MRAFLLAVSLLCLVAGGAFAQTRRARIGTKPEIITRIRFEDFSQAPSRTTWMLLPDGRVFQTLSLRENYSSVPRIERYAGRCNTSLFRRAATLLQAHRVLTWNTEPLDPQNGAPNEYGVVNITTNRRSRTAQVLNFDDGTRDADKPSVHMQRLKVMQALRAMLRCPNLRKIYG